PIYNARGYDSQIRESREGTAGKIYWTVQTMNARGQVTAALMGNGTQLTASFDPATGATLQLMDATGSTMAQDLLLAWDAMGNLRSRRDWSGSRNQEEQFFYDARNRLTRTDSRVNGGTWVANRQVQTYNVAGNMLTKTGLGTYTYGSTRPHAVTSAGGVTYTYDANGNVISDTSGRAFHYTGYDLVRRVSQGTAHTEFHYDAGRSRTLKRELSGSTITSRTHYLGSVEVVWNGSNPTTGVGQYRRTIGGVVINTFYQSTGVNQQRYLHRDHLGSIVAISDEAGQIVTWMAFDPWGQRRNADAWHPWNAPPSVYLNAMLAITPRGFTGHEHVDSAGIIHMNGRIYDPRLGRFLQADPFVEDSTTLNRYTYVHNNPLAYTDPSGYFSFKKILKLAAVVAISVYTGGVGIGIFSLGTISGSMAGFAVAVAGGALAGGVSAGSLEGALWGAFTAAVFTGIGTHVKGLAEASTIKGVFGSGLTAGQFATAAVGSGVAGGTLSQLQGGKFGHGFLSAGVGFTAGAGIARIGNPVGRGAATAILGGTVSKVTGGKFANGATTAAMTFALTASFHSAHASSGTDTDSIFDSGFEDRSNRSLGSRVLRGALDIAGKVWTLPNTVIGLAVGAVSYVAGWAGYGLGFLDLAPSITFGNNAIQFENIPFGNGALTLGNTIIYGGGTAPDQMGNLYGDSRFLNLGRHEMGHTFQYQAYGPFFLPAYFLRGGISATNPFEQGANNYAAGGR
ncbi:MAG: RHS repeat-associated core domain-containing protein, partial [Wenzhouxiangella sp.]